MADIQGQRHVEMLETLGGARPKARSKAAVRLEDLQPLLELPVRLQSATVAAAPTQAEHNALVADLHNVYNRLFAVQELISKRVLNRE